MNLVNLFGSKQNTPEPEYFLAVEIHESLIKTALWEVLEGQPQIAAVGSYESWTDEESLINGVDSSLDQAVKIIKTQPKRVIFGLPESWMESEKIHSTKIKLISHLCKELGLDPIGVVPTNRAIAHYLKKREGMPPTVVLLEVYTSKVAVSHVYLGEVKRTEEVARSGDLAHDVEEGLTRMDLSNYPARFILTNGGGLEEESQQITAFPWTDRLPFKHIPKVEVLPIDFSIKSIALTGGIEAVQYLGLEINEAVESEPGPQSDEESNIVAPLEAPTSIEELGFTYEQSPAPEIIPHQEPEFSIASDSESSEISGDDPEYAFSDSNVPAPVKPKIKISLPSIPRFSFPTVRSPLIAVMVLPLLIVAGFVAYLFLGEALVTIHFDPQKISKQLSIAIAETPQADVPTLIATKQTFTGAVQETAPTTGTANVGDKAQGAVTVYNASAAPILLKSGTTIGSENGKYNYSINEDITIASKSADLLSGSEVFGKKENIAVSATKIGAEYNLLKNSIFSVGDFSKTVAYAVAEGDFAGGTSRTVNAVSKADQDKVLGAATERIISQVQEGAGSQTPGYKTLALNDVQFTKKEFDHDINEEATALNLNLEGSLDTLVYSEDSIYQLVEQEIKDTIPAGSYITKEGTDIQVENPTLEGERYIATVNVSVSLYPKTDDEKLAGFIRGKRTTKIRHFFEPIQGFSSADIKISPAIPVMTQIIPLKNIKFELVGDGHAL